MSVNSIIDEFEKDSSITAEQIASQLLNTENLPLKTEIPFASDVEFTAMMKDACELVGDLFMDVEISKDGKTFTPVDFSITDKKGEEHKIPFGLMIAIRLKSSIGFSEEYAVSHLRQGRTEIKDIMSKRMEERQIKTDTLSKFTNGRV